MSRFWSDVVRGLTPYVPGEQPKLANLVKLNTNENPYGPSPRVLEAMRAETGDTLQALPRPECRPPQGSHRRLFTASTPQQVFVGNGSDEVLAHVFLGLLKHERPMLFPDITYSFYPVYCGLYGIAYETVPLADDFRIRVDDYATAQRRHHLPQPECADRPRCCRWPTSSACSQPTRIQWWSSTRPTSISAAKRAMPLIGTLPQPAGGADAVEVALAGRPARRLRRRPRRSDRGAGAGQEQLQLLSARPPGHRRRRRRHGGPANISSRRARPSSAAARR